MYIIEYSVMQRINYYPFLFIPVAVKLKRPSFCTCSRLRFQHIFRLLCVNFFCFIFMGIACYELVLKGRLKGCIVLYCKKIILNIFLLLCKSLFWLLFRRPNCACMSRQERDSWVRRHSHIETSHGHFFCMSGVKYF